MRVLIVDTAVSGHHLPYLRAIVDGLRRLGGITVQVVLPSDATGLADVVLPFPKWVGRMEYIRVCVQWIDALSNIVCRYAPDAVHLLTGDMIYRLADVGISRLAGMCGSLLVTQHHLPLGRFRLWAFKRFARLVRKVVVHTEYMQNVLLSREIYNTEVVDYPALHHTGLEMLEARAKLHLPAQGIVLLFLGAARYDKGLDILLSALNYVSEPFVLAVAGQEADFKREYIESVTQRYAARTHLDLRLLTDAEFGWYLDAANCLVLPYRSMFTGSSGPLVEAVWRRKPVIAPSHGSVGDLVRRYRLGFVFEPEDSRDLARVIQGYLRNPESFLFTEQAEGYRSRLAPNTFVERYAALYRACVG